MNQAKNGEWYIPEIGYGGIESGHLWAEPKNDQASALYFDANFEKAFKIDDISSVFHYELTNDIGGMDSFVTGGKNELRCEDLVGMVSEEKITGLPPVSLADASEDYILDVAFSEKVPELDYQFCEEWSFVKPSSEIHSPVTSNQVIGISESSVPTPKCVNHKFGQETCGQMQDISECKFRYGTVVEDELALKCSLACDLENMYQTKDVQSLHEVGNFLDNNIGNTCLSQASTEPLCTSASVQDDEAFHVNEGMETEDVSVGELSTDCSSQAKIGRARQRRLCKPPQRYMDGSTEFKSKLHKTRKSSGTPLKDKGLGFRSQPNHPKGKKTPTAIVHDVELQSDDDEYEALPFKAKLRKTKKKSFEKKVNNVWTLDEVVTLVDGLALHGIGQWTAVKRNFFTSSYRTATDIRDKWRNLVKSNCRNLKSMQKKEDQRLRHGTQSLPNDVVERVRELASSQPTLRWCGGATQDRDQSIHARNAMR